jgi:short-subunit dehydrogenase involved in D-alanine esterification of teichoic acids
VHQTSSADKTILGRKIQFGIILTRPLFDAAEKAYGGVDVLVNNAGIMALSTIAETDDAHSIGK